MQTNWQDILNNSSTSLKQMVDLVKYPVFKQKSTIGLWTNRQYTFDVDVRLTKPQIKKLFEAIFDVNIVSVNTHIPPRKKIRVGMAQGLRPRYKRAIITLKEGQSITFKATSLAENA